MAESALARRISNPAYLWNVVFGLTILVYAVGLFIPIMEPDAAVYAQVSMEMHDRGDYLSVYHKGADWLDKPHFPFWMSALSYEVFGVNAFAYKLPAVCFVLLGAFYTFAFCKRFYAALHGYIAVIILLTAEHIIISNQDVRAEPFMTGLMMMALYHFASLISRPPGNLRSTSTHVEANGSRFGPAAHKTDRSSTVLHLVFGSLATACLIMTKGLFTIIPVASGIGLSLIYEKRWKDIFQWRWLVALLLTALFLTPAVYGYYSQFDLHPEKTVFGQNNISGVKFFLWTSQWGRFTNTGPIKGKGDITFFIHTLLWAFLPWAFAAFFALFRKVKELLKGVTSGENYTFFGFITLFIIFSASSFQLSFYLNPLFPFLAILTTAMLLKQSPRIWKIFSVIHLVLCVLLVVALICLHFLFSANIPHVDTVAIVICGLLVGFFLFTRRGNYIKKAVFATALIVVSINYYLNREFYPELLTYQAESEAANYIKANNIPASDVLFADEMQSIADVILHHPTKVIPVDSLDATTAKAPYLYTTAEGKERLDSIGIRYNIVQEFDDFPVTRLTGKFINKTTRHLEVRKEYLLKIEN